MRYSETEAMVIIEQLKKSPISDLDTLFNRATLPIFEDLEGKTAGAILTLNPKNPWWLTGIFHVAFKSPLGKWTGKKRLTSFNEGEKSYGINLFDSKYFSQLFST